MANSLKRKVPLRRVSAKGRKTKGGRGEREVAAIWRSWGFPRACPTPGSGGMRPYGARDVSPWPGDIAFIAPFICEVKYDEQVKAPSRGWMGEAFIRRTAKDTAALAIRHNAIVGGERVYPVIMARANFMAWEAWVPEHMLLEAFDIEAQTPFGQRWVCLGPAEMFAELFVHEDGRSRLGGDEPDDRS